MIVAVVAVRVMQPPVHQVVDVVSVRDGLVAAAGAVRVSGVAVGLIGVTLWMLGVDVDHVLVDVVAVRVVEMTIVQEVDVVVVANRRVATAVAMQMGVVAFVNRVGHGVTVERTAAAAKAIYGRPERPHMGEQRGPAASPPRGR